MSGPEIVEVAVALPVAGTFTYLVPAALRGRVGVGSRVTVPFGRRAAEGIVVALAPPGDGPRDLLPIGEVLDAEPVLDEAMVRLLRWAAEYYQAPPGEALALGLPPALRRHGTVKVRLTAQGRAALAARGAALHPEELTLTEREAALLSGLSAAGTTTRQLRRRLGEVTPLVRRLQERGLCAEIRSGERSAGRREKVITAVHLPNEEQAAALSRAPRRRAVLDHLAARPLPVALRDLGSVPGARGQVPILERLGLLETGQRVVAPSPAVRPDADVEAPGAPVETSLTLTEHQAQAVAKLEAALQGGFQGFLLHGVTGSGKTEVYLRLARQVRASGKAVIVLVPEIALTPQLCGRFRGRFGNDVALLHSGLSPADRVTEWRRLQRGDAGIAVGARSAIFAPARRVGLIVVDEEHDASFKQEEGVRYHARDLALVRAQHAGAVALLGSATPSLESYANARAGRLHLLELPHRVTPRPLPTVDVIDLRRHRPGRDGLFSAPLLTAMRETLTAGEQTILFLNRRGFATSVLCTSCGEPVRCRHCSVSLTVHRAQQRLVCHYCSFTAAVPRSCPACGAVALREVGTGTERIEEALQAQFPEARVARLDRDTAHGRGLSRILDGLRQRSIDIVVGTQLVTKGHDFAAVTLVGVLLADTGLALPDFRAAERTFQLLTQVAGRAGRGERPGRVLVQTYGPLHPSVVCAAGHDYQRFFAEEIGARRELGYPPHGRLVMVRVEAESTELARQGAEKLAAVARGQVGAVAAVGADGAARALPTPAPSAEVGSRVGQVAILGPAEAPLPRLRGRHRWQLLLRGPERRAVHAVARVLGSVELPPGVRRVIDVDPVSTL